MPINRFSKENLEAWDLRYFEPVQSSPKKAGRHGPPSIILRIVQYEFLEIAKT